MSNKHIEVKPVAGNIGAEIYGVDLSRSLSDEAVAEIRQALLSAYFIALPLLVIFPSVPMVSARK